MVEEKKEKAARKFRGKAAIVKLLQEQVQSGQSIKSYCTAHGIAEGTFHNWKQRYGARVASASGGFTTLQVVPESGLFATVGNKPIF